jgi:hypothetical protein
MQEVNCSHRIDGKLFPGGARITRDPDLYGRIILKWILNKQAVMVLTGFYA